MPELRFRVTFGGQPATEDDLAKIEEITVEQTEDAAWEARIKLALCLDEQGNWALQNDMRLAARTAVRIELKIGAADYAPLIDGPIVSLDTAMDSRPGRSTLNIVVHDDSAWLNLESGPVSTDGQSDEQVARTLFTTRSRGHVTQAQVQIPPGMSPPSLGPSFAQLGTPMQMLRQLAARNGCHAYVLPGPTAGASIGCLKPDPGGPPTLPPLVLFGEGQNLEDVTATEDPESSQRTTAHSLRLSDLQVVSYTARQSDEALLGDAPAAGEPAERQARPGTTPEEDAPGAAAARDRSRNFPVRYSGRTISGCYPAVLQPYQKVALHAGAGRTSTILLLTQVTHRITPSVYTVEFEGRGNSLSQLTAAAGLPAGIL